MKIVATLSLAWLLVALVPGCASNEPAAPKNADSQIEAPAPVQTSSGTEIHGSISTSISGRIK